MSSGFRRHDWDESLVGTKQLSPDCPASRIRLGRLRHGQIRPARRCRAILVRVESTNAPTAIAPGGERQLDGNLTPYDATTNPTGVLFDWVSSGGPKQGLENNNLVANNWQWNLTTETQLWRNSKLEVGW